MEMQAILQHIFNRSSMEDIDLSEFRELADSYPFFNAAQFLLAKKMQQTGDENYLSQLQKTSLYFHDPLWMDYLTSAPLQEELIPAFFKPGDQEPSEDNELRAEDQQTVDTALPDFEEVEEISLPEEEDADLTAPGLNEEPISKVITVEENLHPEESLQQEIISETEVMIPEQNTLQEEESFHEAVDTPEETLSTEEKLPEKEMIISEEQMPEETGIVPAQEKPALSPGPVFSPYHTVDYFASLGIKLSQETGSDDKLGKQLRSFTQWLKTMRRLPETEVETAREPVRPDLNAHIEQIAAHSLEEKEILTEAMAEVLVKQGRKDKAASLYKKLSLINPHKSAYFAAKINDLNLH